MDRKRKWLVQMLQINLRWNELYWSSPFFTAESCRFRFLSAPHLHRSRKPKETPWHSPTPTRGVPGCSGKMCTSWGWWCQWYVFFLSHFLLSLSLYLLLTKLLVCFYSWSTNKSAYVDARSMALCVLPGFFHHLKSWARGERTCSNLSIPPMSENLRPSSINQSLVVWSKWVFKHL